MSKARYAINIDDGRIVFRTTATDALRALYRNVDDDVVKAIRSGEVTATEVVDAIMAEERYSGKFSWKEFEQSRKALNMRSEKIEMNDTEEEATEAIPEDEPGSVVTISLVKKSAGKSKPAQAKKKTAEEPKPEEGKGFPFE